MPPKKTVRPPSMRSLAQLAGVCPMTVSLSLRNHPSISEPTRERIKKLALAQGYRPDPRVGQLMKHLRTRRAKNQSGAMICAIGEHLGPRKRGYADLVLAGARQRAEELGFYLDAFWLEEVGHEPRRLRRLLNSRGVEGVLLLPMAKVLDLGELLDWQAYSIVSTSATIHTPHVHAILPDQFGNAVALCEHLAAKGCRRIGLVTTRNQHERVRHRVAAAVSWHNIAHQASDIVPLISEDWTIAGPRLRTWIKTARPDAIITEAQAYLDVIKTELTPAQAKRVTLACTSLHPDVPRYPGIDENPAQIGAAAIEQLDWLYQHGERGPPDVPRVALIEGTFTEPA